MKIFVVFLLFLVLLLPTYSSAMSHEEMMQKIQDLSRQLEELKKQMDQMKSIDQVRDARVSAVERRAEEAVGKWSWLTISGEYRFRLDSLRGDVHDYMQYNPFSTPYTVPDYPMPGMSTLFLVSPVDGHTVKNESVLFNRFRLNLNAQATENINFKSRLVMNKVWGHETMSPIQGSFFGDRAFGPFDGTVGHVPEDNTLRVDYVYATWSNIFDSPVWFSIGRRPSTEGVPGNFKLNTEKVGTAGVPCFLVDYAFDGLTLGVAPDIPALPGAYAKL